MLCEHVKRLNERFGIVGSPPRSGRRPYPNFYADGDRRRVGGVTLNTRNSPRFYAVLDPSLASTFPRVRAG